MIINDKYVRGKENSHVPAHLNFGKYILHSLKQMGDKVALVNASTGEQLTYQDIVQYTVNLGSALKQLGIGKGDVVALGSENCIHFIPNLLSITFTGATCTPYDLTAGEAALRHRISAAKPSYFICSKLFLERYEKVLQTFDFIKIYLTLDKNVKSCIKTQYITLPENVDVENFEPKKVLGQIDTSLILYSSGTTGMPKGVRITHLNLIMNTLPENFKDESTQNVLISGLWIQNYDMFMTYAMLAAGKKIIYAPNLSLDNVLRCIEKYQVNVIMNTPYFLKMISKEEYIGQYNLYSLKIICSAGSALHRKTIEKVMTRFPKLQNVFQVYGMTENGIISSDIYAVKGPKWGSAGMAAPGVIIKIVDPITEKILGPNETGEIRIAGLTCMKEYIGIDPSTYLDEEGFLKTGDLGYYDDDKYLFIVDRIKDLIKYMECQVAPLELETILERHPAVLEAAVIGTPDSYYGELPTAFVVKKSNSDVAEKELIEFVSAQVDTVMQLHGGLKFIETLPRSPRGKILRRKLREMLI